MGIGKAVEAIAKFAGKRTYDIHRMAIKTVSILQVAKPRIRSTAGLNRKYQSLGRAVLPFLRKNHAFNDKELQDIVVSIVEMDDSLHVAEQAQISSKQKETKPTSFSSKDQSKAKPADKVVSSKPSKNSTQQVSEQVKPSEEPIEVGPVAPIQWEKSDKGSKPKIQDDKEHDNKTL
ncbi:MAG: hypothetical protein ISR65_02150 [Bacteriovoracaceae bacterium]|nr:hypothetical protein [Bacteriovoracaceae bacterium]